MELKNEIKKQIKCYEIDLLNLKDNYKREFDNLSTDEHNHYEQQIQLTAKIIRGLKSIESLSS